MNVRPIESLLPHLADGVLVLDPAGTVVLCNERARALVDCENGERITQAPLRAALSSALESDAPPIRFALAATSGAPVDAVLTANGQSFMIVLKPAVGASDEITIANVLGIVDSELRVSMDELARTAGVITETLVAIENGDDGEELPLLMETASNMLDLRNGASAASRLQRIMSLAALYGRDPVVSNDRIGVNQLLGDALALLATRSPATGELRVDMSEGDDFVIYGSRRWLAEAVAECLRDLAASSATGQPVRIEVFPHDARVSVRMQAVHCPEPGHAAGLQRDVGALIARRIVEMHGGRLRQGFAPGRRELFLELPTGGHAAASESLAAQQAERYAQDIVTLLSRRAQGQRPARSAASKP